MRTGRIFFLLFILVAIAQLIVPGMMVLDNERVLTDGTVYKFRTAPVDPLDYFRGKYVALSFSDMFVETGNEKWEYGEKAYAVLATNDSGFAVIKQITRDEPASGDHVKVHIQRVSDDPPYTVTVEYPFTRFYMDENYALDAERAYNAATREMDAYAVVRVKEGVGIIEDVIVDGKPIRQAAEEFQESQ